MSGRVSLIAHRGQPLTYPENSLQGFSFVLESGAGYIETDVNITADGVAVLSHDANLLKLTGKQLIVADHNYQDIKDLAAGYPERFAEKFTHCRIASVKQLADLLKDWPDVTCFIEIKEPCINYYGMTAVDIIVQSLTEILSQVVIISFNEEALLHVKQKYQLPIGWVIPDWTEENQKKAIALDPRYLFVDSQFCPQQTAKLWTGNWEWAVYTVNSAEQVEHFAGLGIELIETDRYSELTQESKIVEKSNDF